MHMFQSRVITLRIYKTHGVKYCAYGPRERAAYYHKRQDVDTSQTAQNIYDKYLLFIF